MCECVCVCVCFDFALECECDSNTSECYALKVHVRNLDFKLNLSLHKAKLAW